LENDHDADTEYEGDDVDGEYEDDDADGEYESGSPDGTYKSGNTEATSTDNDAASTECVWCNDRFGPCEGKCFWATVMNREPPKPDPVRYDSNPNQENYPIPVLFREDKQPPLYRGQTQNPRIVHAIVEVAMKNLPNMDLRFAIRDPIPDMPESSPGLYDSSVFLDEDPSWRKSFQPIPDPDRIFVTFVKGYYTDGRHLIGYDVGPTTGNPVRPGLSGIEKPRNMNMLFTPCSGDDLRNFRLLKHIGLGYNCADYKIGVTHGTWYDATEPIVEEWYQGWEVATEGHRRLMETFSRVADPQYAT
jgi:hypothetical protein